MKMFMFCVEENEGFDEFVSKSCVVFVKGDQKWYHEEEFLEEVS